MIRRETPLFGIMVDPGAAGALFEQLYEALRQRVVDGVLVAGDRLPASRKLADELGVSRTTVLSAYDQLIAEGFAQSRRGSGVFVSAIGEIEHVVPQAAVDNRVAPAAPGSGHRPFRPGLPDQRLFPLRQWAKCVARVARTSPEALVYAADAFGDPALRDEICRYLAEWRGLQVGSDQVLITAGAMDALELCVRTLTGPRDSLLLEDPGYPPLRVFAENLGLPIARLAMDRHGGVPPDGSDTGRLAVLTPSSQYPLGGAMPQARRNAFLDWAARTGGWIIEDDYDSEFRYAGRPIPALAGLDENGRTLYVGSFSKVFSNGLRMGFIVLPPGLVSTFGEALQRFGSRASVVPQRPLALFMASGDYYRHIRRVRRIYAERRQAFIGLLETHLGELASFVDHRAGMQIAVGLPPAFRDTEIAAAAERQGLACSPLSRYYVSARPGNGLLMGFCASSIEEMTAAMPRLKRVIDGFSR